MFRAFRVRTASQAERRRVDTLSTKEISAHMTRMAYRRDVSLEAARPKGPQSAGAAPCSEAAALVNRDDIQPGRDDYA